MNYDQKYRYIGKSCGPPLIPAYFSLIKFFVLKTITHLRGGKLINNSSKPGALGHFYTKGGSTRVLIPG